MTGYIDIDKVLPLHGETETVQSFMGREVDTELALFVNPFDAVRWRDIEDAHGMDSRSAPDTGEILKEVFGIDAMGHVPGHRVAVPSAMRIRDSIHPVIKAEFETADIIPLRDDMADIPRNENMYPVNTSRCRIVGVICHMRELRHEFRLFSASRKMVRMLFSIVKDDILAERHGDGSDEIHLSWVPTLNSPDTYNYMNRDGEFMNGDGYASCERMDTEMGIGIINTSTGRTNLINKFRQTLFGQMVIGTVFHYKAIYVYLIIHKRERPDIWGRTNIYTFVDYNFNILYETSSKRKANLYVKRNMVWKYNLFDTKYTFVERLVLFIDHIGCVMYDIAGNIIKGKEWSEKRACRFICVNNINVLFEGSKALSHSISKRTVNGQQLSESSKNELFMKFVHKSGVL